MTDLMTCHISDVMERKLPIGLVEQWEGKMVKYDYNKYPDFPVGVVWNQLSYLLQILCCLKNKGGIAKDKVQIPGLTKEPHLTDCFTCCRIVLFIIHV